MGENSEYWKQLAKQKVEEYGLDLYCQDELYDVFIDYCEPTKIVNDMNKKIDNLTSLLEDFCLLSNNLSVFARSDIKTLTEALEDIAKMYQLQCKVEEYLEELDLYE